MVLIMIASDRRTTQQTNNIEQLFLVQMIVLKGVNVKPLAGLIYSTLFFYSYLVGRDVDEPAICSNKMADIISLLGCTETDSHSLKGCHHHENFRIIKKQKRIRQWGELFLSLTSPSYLLLCIQRKNQTVTKLCTEKKKLCI